MNNEGAVSARRRAIRRAAACLLLAGAALGVQPVSAQPQPQPQPQGQAPAQDWIISVLEGDAVVIDGVRRVTGTAGLRLEPGAIVETSAKTGIVRIEGSDQSTYDLGPDTRVMLAPPGFGTRGERAPQVYLLQGWLKGTARGPREAAGIVTPAEYAVLKRRNELRDIVIRVDDFAMDFGLSQRQPVPHKAAA